MSDNLTIYELVCKLDQQARDLNNLVKNMRRCLCDKPYATEDECSEQCAEITEGRME